MRFRWTLSNNGSMVLALGLAVLLVSCAGGSSQPPVVSGTPAFHTQLTSSDGAFLLQFGVTPDHLGSNLFTVQVQDTQKHLPVTNLQVQLATTMLDMAMGTDMLTLQSTGHGAYSGQGFLSMSGHWQIQILLRTPDAILHTAQVKLDVSRVLGRSLVVLSLSHSCSW